MTLVTTELRSLGKGSDMASGQMGPMDGEFHFYLKDMAFFEDNESQVKAYNLVRQSNFKFRDTRTMLWRIVESVEIGSNEYSQEAVVVLPV